MKLRNKGGVVSSFIDRTTGKPITLNPGEFIERPSLPKVFDADLFEVMDSSVDSSEPKNAQKSSPERVKKKEVN
jgi:hypothetical protein